MEQEQKMEPRDGYLGLGQLRLEGLIELVSLFEVSILECENEHGILWVRGYSEEPITELRLLRLEGACIRLRTVSGTLLFSGEPDEITWKKENQLYSIHAKIVSHSAVWDREKRKRVFQEESKTLQDIADHCMGANGYVQAENNIVLSEIVVQEQETDWEFIKRISNEREKPLFVNGKADRPTLHIGSIPFAIKELYQMEFKGIHRNINKVRRAYEGDTFFGIYELDEWIMVAPDLSIGIGCEGSYLGRSYLVVQREMITKKGLLLNQLTCVMKCIVIPVEHEEENVLLAESKYTIMNTTKGNTARLKKNTQHASILLGNVTEVTGTRVKVLMEGQGGKEQWIPFQGPISNTVYTMPDVGDRVFVYQNPCQPRGILSLGSARETEREEFKNPDNKSFRSNNQIIQFTRESIRIISNQEEFEKDTMPKQNHSSIQMEEGGIVIYSSGDILIESKKNVKICSITSSLSNHEVEEKANLYHQAGFQRFQSQGGKDATGRMQKSIEKKEVSVSSGLILMVPGSKNETKDTTLPVNPVDTVSEMAIFNGAAITLTKTKELDQGIVMIQAGEKFRLKVGDSKIFCEKGEVEAGSLLYLDAPFVKMLGNNRDGTFPTLSVDNTSYGDQILAFVYAVVSFAILMPSDPVTKAVLFALKGAITIIRTDGEGGFENLLSTALMLSPFKLVAQCTVSKDGPVFHCHIKDV